MNLKIFHHLLALFTFLGFQSLSLELETDTISGSLVIKDPDTIVSPKQVFELGFFTPKNSTNRYLGIFYTFSKETVIWVGNRDNPLNDSSGYVAMSKDGNLVLFDGRNQIVWSTNATTSSPMNTTAQILDTGNLVLIDNATGATVWEAFSHPTDVFMRTMKVSHNIRTGEKVFVSSWKNASDPREGRFTSGLDASLIPQIVIWENGRTRWRSGPWNGLIFIGIQKMYISHLYGGEMRNDSAGNFDYSEPEKKLVMNTRLNSSGSLVRSVWDDQKKSWSVVWWTPENECDIYGKCGSFGSCNSMETPICSCLKGFEPSNQDEWERGNWSSGCRRSKNLQCGEGGIKNGFLRLPFMKVPDFGESFYSEEKDECKARCQNNCSCIAYAHESSIGCMFWYHALIDTQKFNGIGVDLYIRLSASELDNSKSITLYVIIPVVAAFVCMSILALIVAWCWMAKRKVSPGEKKSFEEGQTMSSDSTAIVLQDESQKVDIGELPQFTFEMLANATDQFHQDNLLGRGGFGPVYKGSLTNGKAIAVKRLSAASGQGMQEFMNEVIVISKLQHRNLVRLLGCCVEREEKMLIYEYMPNKSLDVCLFDETHHPQKQVLDWKKRFNIIEGIGRGLLYLHKDSRLRIIHRDLKPSNVLLDQDWNPKISDFGMARIFGGNQDHGDTARVVGTYGYMAPEYAMEGRFSEKSDVYSFGVLMLEIVKGRKNTHFYHQEWCLSLLGCAWKLWSEDNGMAFVDESIRSSDLEAAEIGRCIQIALLCVQEHAKDRPTIQTVVSMLSREIVELPAPEQPVFAEKWNGLTTGSTHPQNQHGCSINGLTLTAPYAR